MNRLIVASDNRKMQKKKSYREPLEESIIITIFIFLFVMADVTFLISLLKSSNPSVGMLVLLFLVYLELIMIRRVIDIEELRLWILKRIDLLFLLVFFVFLKVVVYSEIVDIVSDKFTSVLLLMSIYSLYRLVILTYHLVNNSDFNRSFLKIALLFVFLFVLFIDTSATLNILIYNSDNITSFKGLSLTNDNQIFDLYYYTVINITSVGFGDITPLSQDARFLSIVTSILGYLTFASFLAIALTNFSSKKNENDIEYKEEESILK
ncbi:MAG: two pore domain potassium channel family protein [Bacilli bacterium]|nr:two pore domain potassium channel family protein [Bacilli bacterium]